MGREGERGFGLYEPRDQRRFCCVRGDVGDSCCGASTVYHTLMHCLKVILISWGKSVKGKFLTAVVVVINVLVIAGLLKIVALEPQSISQPWPSI